MTDLSRVAQGLPLEQQAIRANCFHPSGSFVEFKKEEIEQSIPSRFEQIVRRYPEHIAVKTKHHELTYAALNKMANRVARAILSQRGTGPEPIALLLEHGAPAIAAILGLLKAGSIYVPLDPTYPHARIASMLEDLQAALIVTNNKNLSQTCELVKNVRHQLLNIDELDASLSTQDPDLCTSPDSLACILYTSGSTGQPKGVVHPAGHPGYFPRAQNLPSRTFPAHLV